ncbi:molybdopterin biosynthesis protein [Maritimibacter sp. 55A14]|uniref:molybdopterin-binding protein n=1 Tax=Maritimibacter sp. 55A14 TaxID=2174844 RepID=UPI000D61DD8C|nr:molybdopterin-binding protein [Maritimibacter sp. 55A14]PWE31992.1 molybdopterin biosynthesis protein [Maritimibacter sp. 55A14]
MRFGPVPLAQAQGAVLAHSLAAGPRKLRKGRALGDADIAALEQAGIAQVTVAQLEPGDLGEDAAAARIAAALAPDPAAAGLRLSTAATGRVNLYAVHPGVLALDPAAIARLNAVDPAITLATLPTFARVAAGQMVATVKIITYGVPGEAVARVRACAGDALSVRPVVLPDAGLILTEVPGQSRRLRDKARAAMRGRLDALGMALAESPVVPHETGALAEALRTVRGALVLILTGSATSDPRDVGPEALRRAGGRLTRFGMPVDPGNLVFLGDLGGRAVIGLPGSMRSPVPSGGDWVLQRIACGLDVSDADIAAMGVGGLLKESAARPHPRERR